MPPKDKTPEVKEQEGFTAKLDPGEDRVAIDLDVSEAVEVIRQRICDRKALKVLIAILGGPTYEETTADIVRELATQCQTLGHNVAFLTCGMPGVQELFTEHCALPEQCWNVLAMTEKATYNKERVITVGQTAQDRDDIFVYLSHMCIVIEGAQRTAKMATAAQSRGAALIPLVVTGGASNNMYGLEATKASTISAERWLKLQDMNLSLRPKEYVANVVSVIGNFLVHQRQRDQGMKLYANYLRREAQAEVQRALEQEPPVQNHLETWTAGYYRRRGEEGKFKEGSGRQLADTSGHRRQPQRAAQDEMLEKAKSKAALHLKAISKQAGVEEAPSRMQLQDIMDELAYMQKRRLMLMGEASARGAKGDGDEIFRLLDTNHDGVVDISEFNEINVTESLTR